MAVLGLLLTGLGVAIAFVLHSVWAGVLARLHFPEVEPTRAQRTMGRVDALEALDLGWLAGTVYELRYHYVVRGQTYPGVSYPEAPAAGFTAGAELTVRFDGRRPQVSVAEGARVAPRLQEWRVYLLLALVPGVGLFAFLVCFELRRRERALVRSGVEAAGRVDRFVPSRLEESRAQPYYWMHFSFVDSQGQERRRRRLLPGAAGAVAWEADSPVTVFHDRRRPDRALPYEPLLGMPAPAAEIDSTTARGAALRPFGETG